MSKKKYLYGLDLSMSNTGVAIFDGDALVYVGSISTSDKDNHGIRLKKIYNNLKELNKQYPPSIVAIERGFSRFNTSTAVLYRVHGCVNMLFSDVEQIYYPPKTVKEAVGGRGDCSKKVLAEKVREIYKDTIFENEDETDACAVGLTYIYKNRKGEQIGQSLREKQI